MNDLELQVKLTREMTSKDFCHQRIFSCHPLLWRIYGNYMSQSKNYNFPKVFLEVIKEWNNERNIDVKENYGNSKFDLAIAELNDFYKLICQIYDSYYNDNYLDIDLYKKIQEITLSDYKDLSTMCKICIRNDNRSKILCRLSTLKKKTVKFFDGIISIEQFMEEEITPQKHFLDIFIDKLKLFDKNQFCIFMLCYDIKKTNETIFKKTKYDTADPFLI